MADGLVLRIGADVTPAVQGLQQVEQRMRSTVAAGQSFGKGIDKSVQSLSKLPGSSNQATQSLINLSRVAQDAPYGFIGIANNINPLLESFQRLKASTGTTGVAMQALKSALMGPAGVGLAVGVVSSLLVVFGDRLFGSSKRAKDLKESAEELKKVLDGISKTKLQADITGEGAAASEIAKVSILSEVVKDQTKSYNERNNALLQLQKINKNYFGDLSIEKLNVELLTKAVNDYSNALIAAEVVKVLGKDVADLNVQKAKELNKYNKLLKEQSDAEKELRKAQSYQEVDRLGNVTYTYGAKVFAASKNIESLNKALSKQGAIILEIDDNILQSGNLLRNAISESLKFKPLNVYDQSGTDDKAEEMMRQTVAKAKRIFKETESIIYLPLSILDEDDLKTQFAKAKSWLHNYATYNGKLKIPVDMVLSTPPPEVKTNFTSNISDIVPEINRFSKNVLAPYDKSLWDAMDKWAKHQEQLKNTAGIITGVVTPAFQNMFSTIASGGNAFKAFGDAAVQALTQLISKLVTTAAIAAILGPVLGIGTALGSKTNSFKDVFRSLFGGFRAAGGPVEAGRAYITGEAGRELFIPSVSGSIVPNNQLGSFSTGRSSSSGGSMRAIVRGQNILLAVARTTRGNSRLGLNGI